MATGGPRQIDAGALKLLGKLSNEDAEKVLVMEDVAAHAGTGRQEE